MIVGYRTAVPKALTGVPAYDVFYYSMSDGRTRSQFRNSIKNARDSFDILFDNGRIGWVDRLGQRPSLSGRLQQVHEESIVPNSGVPATRHFELLMQSIKYERALLCRHRICGILRRLTPRKSKSFIGPYNRPTYPKFLAVR